VPVKAAAADLAPALLLDDPLGPRSWAARTQRSDLWQLQCNDEQLQITVSFEDLLLAQLCAGAGQTHALEP